MNSQPVAGVDVSKKFSDMCILAPDNAIYKKLKIFHDSTSMERSLKYLQQSEDEFGQKPVIIMESTAHYHRIPAQFYQRAGYDVIVINPMQSNALKNINIRKVKNDELDAYRIAQLYRLQAIKRTNLPMETLLDLRELCRQRHSLVMQRVRYNNKLIGLLDQCFPGYSGIFCNVKCNSSLALLSHYQTPEAVLKAKPAKLVSIIGRGASRGDNSQYAMKKAKILIERAKEAEHISLGRAVFPILIKAHAEMIIALSSNIKAMDETIIEVSMADSSIDKNIQLLCTIPGIARQSATVLLAEIGDFSMFSRPKQLVAFCGLDPSVKQSGAYAALKNKISKRGSAHMRAALYICSQAAIFSIKGKEPKNLVLADYYNKKLLEKPGQVARCAVMRKMVLYIFAVLRDQQPFEIKEPSEHAKLNHEKPAAKVA